MATPAQTTTKSMAPNAKQYVIVALMAILVAAVIVTVFFIVLSPARIFFSISDAGSHQIPGQSLRLALTLCVNNTSTRARVQYDSIYIDVSNSTGPEWGNWFRTNMATKVPLLQPKHNKTKISATLSLPLLQGGAPSLTLYFTGNMTSNAFAVTVTALARFRVGFARTRLYDIKVKCQPVSFFRNATELHGVAPAPLPVPCVSF